MESEAKKKQAEELREKIMMKFTLIRNKSGQKLSAWNHFL